LDRNDSTEKKRYSSLVLLISRISTLSSLGTQIEVQLFFENMFGDLIRTRVKRARESKIDSILLSGGLPEFAPTS